MEEASGKYNYIRGNRKEVDRIEEMNYRSFTCSIIIIFKGIYVIKSIYIYILAYKCKDNVLTLILYYSNTIKELGSPHSTPLHLDFL